MAPSEVFLLRLTGLEIPVYDCAAVEVPEPDADLVRDEGDLRLGEALLQVHDDRVQRAAVAELQEHLQEGKKGNPRQLWNEVAK